MSMNSKDLALYQLLMNIGRKDAQEHKWFIKDVKSLLKKIILPELSIDERILALHQLGLADDKIDADLMVDFYFKLLSDEREDQEVYLEYEQWKNLADSITRSNYYIEVIARRISPSSLDMAEGPDEGSEKKAKSSLADLAM